MIELLPFVPAAVAAASGFTLLSAASSTASLGNHAFKLWSFFRDRKKLTPSEKAIAVLSPVVQSIYDRQSRRLQFLALCAFGIAAVAAAPLAPLLENRIAEQVLDGLLLAVPTAFVLFRGFAWRIKKVLPRFLCIKRDELALLLQYELEVDSVLAEQLESPALKEYIAGGRALIDTIFEEPRAVTHFDFDRVGRHRRSTELYAILGRHSPTSEVVVSKLLESADPIWQACGLNNRGVREWTERHYEPARGSFQDALARLPASTSDERDAPLRDYLFEKIEKNAYFWTAFDGDNHRPAMLRT